MKNHTSFFAIIAAIFFLTLAPLTNAQEPSNTILPRGALVIEVEEALENEIPPVEVMQDSEISVDAGIVPTGFFGGFLHGIDRAAEAIGERLTFNPTKKAALQSRHALERIAEAEALIKNGDNEGGDDLILAYENKINEAANNFESSDHSDIENEEKFLEKFTQSQVEAGRVLDNLLDADITREDVLGRVMDARVRMIDHLTNVFEHTDLPSDIITDRIQRAFENIPGSGFGNFRNIEVLQELENRVPDQARDAIAQAKQNSLDRLGDHINDLPEDVQEDHLENYIRHIPGSELAHFETISALKNNLDVSPKLLERMEHIKSKLAENFSERFENLQTEVVRKKFFERFENSEFEDVRTLDSFANYVPNEDVREKIKERHEESLSKFRDKFADDSNAQDIADRFERLSEQVRENPDPATFKLLERLHDELTLEQKAFVDSLEQEGREEFERRAREEGERFFSRVTDSNPDHIEFFNNFEAEFDGVVPQEVRDRIFQASVQQAKHLEARLEAIDHPEGIEDFRKRFDEDIPDHVRRQILDHVPDFANRIDTRQDFSEEFQRRLYEEFDGQIPEDFRPDFPPPSFDEREKEGFDETGIPGRFDEGESEEFDRNFQPPNFDEISSDEKRLLEQHRLELDRREGDLNNFQRDDFRSPEEFHDEPPPSSTFDRERVFDQAPDQKTNGTVQGVTTQSPFWSIFLPR